MTRCGTRAPSLSQKRDCPISPNKDSTHKRKPSTLRRKLIEFPDWANSGMTLPRNIPKVLARLVLHRLGGLQALAWYRRGFFQILTYHRFSDVVGLDPVVALRRQCAYIRKNFHPVSMSQVARALRGECGLPPNAIVITVDDGYHDFLTVAAPVFSEYQLPVTVYLITGFLDGRLWPWWDRVAYAVQHTAKPAVEQGFATQNALPLRTDAERQATYSELCATLVKLPDRSRLAALEQLPRALAVNLPEVPPPEYAPLKWEEVRGLRKAGVEFGGHTDTHPILPDLENEHAQQYEVAQSKRRIEEELQSPVLHFCYPNGDFNATTVAAVKGAGFQTAATVLSGYDSLSTDPYLLKRRMVDPDLPDYYLRERLSGLH